MKKRFVVLVMMVVVSLLLTTVVSAKVIRTPFTSTGSVVDVLDYGTMTFPGGNTHVRGMVELMRTESAEARITGWHTLVVNTNFDSNGFGVVWGTYDLDVDAYEGGWKGSLTGTVDENGMSLKIVGHGYGDLAGLRIKGTVLNGVTVGVIIERVHP